MIRRRPAVRQSPDLTPKPPIAGEVNITRITPYSATWPCRCGATNTLRFGFIIAIGHVLGRRIKCEKCPLEWRGMYVTALNGSYRCL
jgi:hypothetical protein